jgi:hypothetical protein
MAGRPGISASARWPCFFTLHFWREGDRSPWEVVDMMLNPGVPYEEAIEVVDEP